VIEKSGGPGGRLAPLAEDPVWGTGNGVSPNNHSLNGFGIMGLQTHDAHQGGTHMVQQKYAHEEEPMAKGIT